MARGTTWVALLTSEGRPQRTMELRTKLSISCLRQTQMLTLRSVISISQWQMSSLTCRRWMKCARSMRVTSSGSKLRNGYRKSWRSERRLKVVWRCQWRTSTVGRRCRLSSKISLSWSSSRPGGIRSFWCTSKRLYGKWRSSGCNMLLRCRRPESTWSLTRR